MRRVKGSDQRELWVPEEVGCRLQEGVPPCKSGMVQEERLQEDSDPDKLWTAARIGRCQEDDPQCKSGTTQGTRASETRKRRHFTENPERANGGEQTLEEPGMQKWHKGPTPKTTATRQQVNKGPRRQTAAMSEEGEGNRHRYQRVEPRTAIAPRKRRNAQEPI
jgi:hypothetical protein